MKAIIDCYNIAKMNGYQFRIVFKIPFRLEDYLLPNEVEWVADDADLLDLIEGKVAEAYRQSLLSFEGLSVREQSLQSFLKNS